MRLLLGLAALLVAAAAPAPAPAPIARSVFASADPDAEAIDGETWVFPTNAPSDRLLAWSSPDLAHWRQRGVLLRLKDIGWVRDDRASKHYLWAPDMVHADGRWLLYYSVGPQNPTPSRLGVAVCVAPEGPCTDSGKALLTGGADAPGGGFEAIDPMVFVDPKSAARYLYTGGSAGARLRVFELAPDMVTTQREVAVPQPVNFTEGVFMHERGGVYYLSYSHGNWQSANYSVHYSTASTPLGPWRYRGPILTSDSLFKGPGHHSFVVEGGRTLIVYHRWEGQSGDGPYSGDRRIAVGVVDYAPDGSILPIKMAHR